MSASPAAAATSLRFRAAREEDATVCAELLQLTMPNILRYWISEDPAQVQRCLQVLFHGAPCLYSRHGQRVAEQAGQVVAVAIVTPATETRRLRLGLIRKLPKLRKVLGTAALARSIGRGLVLAHHSLEFDPDELIVHAMAVRPDLRGRRLSWELHAELRRLALSLGLSKISGGIEAHNARQLALLEALGCQRVATCERVSLRRHGLGAVHKYVRDLRQTSP